MRVPRWCWPALLATLLAGTGCQGTPPARVQLELPEMVLSNHPVKVLVWQWDDRNQRTEAREHTTHSVEPPSLAKIDGNGRLTCLETGDGKVVANVVGVSSSAPLRCRLVDHLEAPNDLGRIDLAAGPVRLDVGAYTKEGKRLDDVPLKITTKNSKLARADGDQLVPLAVGRAKIEVRAGDVGREFDVQFVRRLKPEPIPIDRDTRLSFTLDEGRYELVVELANEKKLSAEWRGAPYCNYSGTARVHTVLCTLRMKGGVVFDNPAYLDTGAKTASHDGVTLHEVPE